jgi:hypothetical protein
MRLCFAVLLASMTLFAQDAPPPLLLIFREPIKPGAEAAYRQIELETAREAVRLGCPHPYLAAESLDEPTEVWWFNSFLSPEDQKRVEQAYKANKPWSEVLDRNAKRKAEFTQPPVGQTATYRRELGGGAAWTPGIGRYLVISVVRDKRWIAGAVFEADDGTRYVIHPAESEEAARKLARTAGPAARVFAVRPELSFAAKEWIARDPEFWKSGAPKN